MREIIRDKGRLEHILEYIDRAFEFTQGISFEEYKTDNIRRFAVVRCVEVVGEASYKLTNEFRECHPEIEWREIIAMRHILIHGYYQADDAIVWDTVKNYFPPLREQIQQLYNNE